MAKRHAPSAAELLELTREDGQLFHDAKARPVELPPAPAPLADTHGHLTHFRQHDPAWALARASVAGLGLLGVPVDPTDDGADVTSLLADLDRWTYEAASHVDTLLSWGVHPAGEDPHALLDRVFLWAGTHPYGAADYLRDARARQALDLLLSSSRAVGVGEIGLDYGPYNTCDIALQRQAFVDQLRLAHELGLPVELHIRDGEGDASAQAHVDAARILEQEGVPKAGCDLHCYTSDAQVMAPFVEMGCFVAFGGAATFARSADIREAASSCPGDLLLCETDSPYMAPVPLRGMECEPAMVAFSADLVARTREEAGIAPAKKTYEDLWANANRFFGLSQG